jgi:hypothetical protein
LVPTTVAHTKNEKGQVDRETDSVTCRFGLAGFTRERRRRTVDAALHGCCACDPSETDKSASQMTKGTPNRHL